VGEDDRRLRDLQRLPLCFRACVGEINDTDNMLIAIGVGLRQGSYIPILFISLIASMPFADRPSCRGYEGFYIRISKRDDGMDSSLVYRRVNEFRVSIMAQCDVAHTKAVEGTQNAVATTDLVQPFYANETRNTAGPTRLPHLMDRSCECQITRVRRNQLVYQINLLQSVAQSFKLGCFTPITGSG
jgi:hypothetical protein